MINQYNSYIYIYMAHKDKIFLELEGVFKWMEHKKVHQGDSNTKEVTSYYQVKEFFNFLNLEVTNDEIEALIELANPDGNASLSYNDLLKVFV